MRVLFASVAFLIATHIGAVESGSFVWWEAEEPQRSDFPKSSWLSPVDEIERDSHSGGNWLTRVGKTDVVFAEYDVHIPADQTWDLWARAFRGEFRWRFDNGPWNEDPSSRRKHDGMVVKRAGKRYLTTAWLRLGKLKLSKGKHTFRIETIAGKAKTIGIDCFMLAAADVVPNGKLKPGECYTRAPEGWFAFDPGRDPLAESPIDMSHLNHRPAGCKGRMKAKGDKIVFEKTGELVRIWGVSACANVWEADERDMEYLAKRLSKMGVNMLRLHCAPFYEEEPGPQTRAIQRFVNIMKKHGVYTGLNWFCQTCKVQGWWEIPGTKHGDRPNGLVFSSKPFQEHYRAQAKTLLGTVNPDTGLSLAQDPAVTFIELVDEDSTLWWTFDPKKLPAHAVENLERQFAAWLVAKYGSLAKAANAWGKVDAATLCGKDDPSVGRMALYAAMHLGGADWMREQRNKERARDQLQFQVHLQREFYGNMKKWLRDEFGYTGLISGSNWKTVDERVVGPLEQYTYLAGDVTTRNTYFSGSFKRHKFHPWSPGALYQDKSLLRNPEQAITSHIQVENVPHFLTEGGFSHPNRFRTEEQLLMASYASLQGTDGLFPFTLELNWSLEHSRWPIQTPVTMGQYPAAALIYRKGYVTEGPAVIRDALALEELYDFKGAATTQRLGEDEFTARQIPEGVTAEVDGLPGVDPLSFYVGRVIRAIGEKPGKPRISDKLRTLIDREQKVIHSATGQLQLNFGIGLLRINTPQAQGVTGFLAKAGAQDLPQVKIDLGNEYGAVVLVALDDLPLSESKRLLLQVMTEEKMYDFRTKPVTTSFKENGPKIPAKEILTNGRPPIVVKHISGTVSVKRPDASKIRVTALDLNGYPREELATAENIILKPDAVYYLLER